MSGGARRDTKTVEARSRIDTALRKRLLERSGAPQIETQGARTRYPLGFTQSWMWQMQAASPGNAAWNRPSSLRLTGRLIPERLERALKAVVARHQPLSMRVHDQGDAPDFSVTASLPPLSTADLSAEAEPSGEALHRLDQDVRIPIDLEIEGPLRAQLLKTGEQEHILGLTIHHMAFDGFSAGIFVEELSACYESFAKGAEPELRPLAFQFGDFALWQQTQLETGAFDADLDWWAEKLGDLAPEEPAVGREFVASNVAEMLAPSLTAQISDLARKERATLFMALLTAHVLARRKATGHDKLTLGILVASRTMPGTEDLIGLFFNPLVLALNLESAATFHEALRHVRQSVLDAFRHQKAPFGEVLKRLGRPEAGLAVPLIPEIIQLRNFPKPLSKEGSIIIEALHHASPHGRFDLTLDFTETERGIEAAAAFATAAHHRDAIAAHIADIERILAASVS